MKKNPSFRFCSSFLHGFPRPNGRRAFSLTELLVVIAIVLVLAALAVPAAIKILERGKGVKCAANMRQLLVAFEAFEADNDGGLPYCTYYGFSVDGEEWRDIRQRFWMRELAPYLGFTFDDAFFTDLAGWNARLPDVFHCPSDPYRLTTASWGLDTVSYGCNHWLTKTVNTPLSFVGTPRTKRIAVERPSEMILLADSGHVEEDPDVAWRIGPVAPGQAPYPRHNGRGNVGWLDGHVTSETAARLTELHTEGWPWPHWQIPP